MKNKILISIFTFIICITLVGCGKSNKVETSSSNNTQSEKKEEKKEETINSNTNSNDDEIIEFDDEDNNNENETITSTLINCNDCVFAIYTDKKTFGDVLTDYTKDYNTLKDKNGKQRRRFMGHIIDSNNKIVKTYTCGIKDDKAFCIEGSTDTNVYQSNINILNKVFSSNQCKYIANGNTYTCTDGKINSDTRADGYVSVHYDDSCYYFGDKSIFGCYSK